MTLAFRELWAETNQIAGFHDGTNLQISPDFLDNHAIRLHEEMHGRIFEETADGKLHICLIKLINQTKDPGIRKRLEGFNSRLFNNTRVPHERIATYLGIKCLPTAEDSEQALASLTNEYRNYYSFFDRLCSKIPTTFVSFSVSWALGRVAFCSSRFESIGDLDDLLSGAFLEIPGPAARLNQLARAVAAMGPEGFQDFVTEKLKSVAASNDLPPFDYNSEEEWTARAGQVSAQRLDRLLIEEIERFACETLGSELKRRYKIPECFLVVEGTLKNRRFNHEFPVEDGEVKLTAEATKFYARELDFQRIKRPGLGNILALATENDLEFLHETLSKAKFDQIHVAVVALRGASTHYSMIVTCRKGDLPEFDFGLPIVGEPDNFNLGLAAIMLACADHPDGHPELSVSIVQELTSEDAGGVDKTWGFRGIRAKLPWICRRPPSEDNSNATDCIVPYFYAREMWSGLLATVDGTLGIWRTVLNINAEEKAKDFVISVLYPKDADWIPYLAVMSYWCHSRYLRLADARIKAGNIKVVSHQEITNELSKTVTALWHSYKVV